MTDNQDNPTINIPPPLIYVVPLALGLVLDRRAPLPFLARGATRGLGWPLLGSGLALNGWFLKTMRDAEAPIQPIRHAGIEIHLDEGLLSVQVLLGGDEGLGSGAQGLHGLDGGEAGAGAEAYHNRSVPLHPQP